MKAENPQNAPYAVEVEAGKNYYWCSCGKSKTQPFCDGAHQGTPFSPVEYKAIENKTVYFCGCKKSSAQPMCDGSHSKY
jgi:CDGSH-type Zn-finger protein